MATHSLSFLPGEFHEQRCLAGYSPAQPAPPPIKPCSTEEPQMDTEEPGQQDHQDRSVHTHSGQA